MEMFKCNASGISFYVKTNYLVEHYHDFIKGICKLKPK